jgi:hypothetical protein
LLESRVVKDATHERSKKIQYILITMAEQKQKVLRVGGKPIEVGGGAVSSSPGISGGKEMERLLKEIAEERIFEPAIEDQPRNDNG